MGDGVGGNGTSTLDTLQSAMYAVKMLRCSAGGVFEAVTAGLEAKEQSCVEEKERMLRQELNHAMQRVFANLRELDKCLQSVTSPIGPFSLGNTSLINQEVSPDKIPLYCQLVDSYKWLEKVREFAGLAQPILGQNPLKRTYFSASLSAKRRKTLASNYVVSPAAVDNSILSIANTYKSMEISISRPLGSNAVLCVVLGRTLRAVVILKGWLIEWVVVRSPNEEMSKEDGSLDLWSESRFKVFQKVTDNANAAMLHYCVPSHPELSVRSFMTWLHSYVSLFTQPCKKCGLHLVNNMPPSWRDLRSLEPFHEECKP